MISYQEEKGTNKWKKDITYQPKQYFSGHHIASKRTEFAGDIQGENTITKAELTGAWGSI